MIILNIFIVNKIVHIDFNKYLSDNFVGKTIKFFIKRYISVWSKSSIYITRFCFIMLTFCVFMTKLCFYLIKHN